MELLGLSEHIRRTPAIVCIVVSVTGLYLGLVAPSGSIAVHDKVQHFLFFFLLGSSLYWVFNVSKKRATQLTSGTLLVTSVLSEFLQYYVTARRFDSLDIAANLLGSGLSIVLNVIYHARLLQRKREAKYASLGISDLEAGSSSPESLIMTTSDSAATHAAAAEERDQDIELLLDKQVRQ